MSKMIFSTFSTAILELCSNWNMTFTQINAGSINVSWSHVAQPSPMPGSTYTYLILYKIVESSDYTNFTFVELGSRTARMNFLHPNTTNSIRMVCYDASSAGNNTVMHTSCPQLVKALGGNIRLVGRANEINNTEGRVEVFYNGAWGTISDNSWDVNDANVVCRSLGLPRAVAAPRRAAFGPGTGPIWMDQVQCMGNETSLFHCPYVIPARLDLQSLYAHNHDASVVCGRPPLISFNVTSLQGVISSPWFPYYGEQAYYQWTFVPAIPRARIALYFEDIDLYHPHLNAVASSLTVKDASNAQLLHITTNTWEPISLVVETPTAKVIVYFSPYAKRYSQGFRMKYFAFSMPEHDLVCNKNWKLRSIKKDPGRITLSWHPLPQAPLNSPFTYLVLYKMVKTSYTNFTSVFGLWTTAQVKRLYPKTTYSMRLIAFGVSSTNNITTIYSCPQLIETLDGALRLVGDSNKINKVEGRVEVFYNGTWGTICDHYWDLKDANVVCRSLGLPRAVFSPRRAAFGYGIGPIWMNNVHCIGNESSLFQCQHGGLGSPHRCHRYSGAAGVLCGLPTFIVRLVGGASNAEGRVEVFKNGQWGTVCDDYWDLNDANVVCRSLDLPRAVAAPHYAAFGPGTGPIWKDDVHCRGNELNLHECQHRALGSHNCEHRDDASVVCGPPPPNIRLVGGSNNEEGRVEVFHSGAWGTICHNSWDLNDANVVCRSLGLPRAVAAPHYAAFGPGTGPIWMAQVQCLGNESSLFHCPHIIWGLDYCEHGEDASVLCGHPPLINLKITNITGVISSPGYPRDMEQAYYQWTFVPRPSKSYNRISLYFEDIQLYRSQWTGASNLTVEDASNTQLLHIRNDGHEPLSFVVETTAKMVYYSSSTCRGRGFRMRYYAFSMSENNPNIRLVGGLNSTEGRVEVFYNDTWGTICDDYWDLNDANVVCRSLGLPRAVAAPRHAAFGPGTGPIWMNNVHCMGNESSLFECRHGGLGSHNCDHSEDVSVVCLAFKPEKPSITRPPSTRRTPSQNDIRNSVNVTIQELSITEWNHEIEIKFKGVVAEEVTKLCSTPHMCLSIKRKRRSTGGANVTFTAQEVHLLPGYPLQLSYSSIPDQMIAVVSFYVKFPPGLSLGFNDTVNRDLLVSVVNGSLVRIGRVINKTVQLTTTSPPYGVRNRLPTTPTNAEPADAKYKQTKPGYVRYAIIGGSVGAVILIIIAIVVLIIRYKKKQMKEQVAIELKTELIQHESRTALCNEETSTV